MDLDSIGTLTLKMAPAAMFAGGPAGTRVIVEFSEVKLAGPRVSASRRGATAGDWLTIGPDDTASLDARFLLETNDGALLYCAGPGRTDAKRFASGAAAVVFSFVFETGDDRYLWLNRCVAIARGFVDGDTVTLDVVAVSA